MREFLDRLFRGYRLRLYWVWVFHVCSWVINNLVSRLMRIEIAPRLNDCIRCDLVTPIEILWLVNHWEVHHLLWICHQRSVPAPHLTVFESSLERGCVDWDCMGWNVFMGLVSWVINKSTAWLHEGCDHTWIGWLGVIAQLRLIEISWQAIL